MVDSGEPELLETLDRTDDVYQCIHRPDLVQGHFGRRNTVDPPLRFAQEGKGPNGSLAHPGRERGPPEDLEQLVQDMRIDQVIVSCSHLRRTPPARRSPLRAARRFRRPALDATGVNADR
jgi:hypothetical protein